VSSPLCTLGLDTQKATRECFTICALGFLFLRFVFLNCFFVAVWTVFVLFVSWLCFVFGSDSRPTNKTHVVLGFLKIWIHRNSVVKYEAIAAVVVVTGHVFHLVKVLQDTALDLIHMLKSSLSHIGCRLFTANSACAKSNNFFVLFV